MTGVTFASTGVALGISLDSIADEITHTNSKASFVTVINILSFELNHYDSSGRMHHGLQLCVMVNELLFSSQPVLNVAAILPATQFVQTVGELGNLFVGRSQAVLQSPLLGQDY